MIISFCWKWSYKPSVKINKILFFIELFFFLKENAVFIDDNKSVFLDGFLSNKYNVFKIDESSIISFEFTPVHKIIGFSSPDTIKSNFGILIFEKAFKIIAIVWIEWVIENSFKHDIELSIIILIELFPIISSLFSQKNKGSVFGLIRYNINAGISISLPVEDKIFSYDISILNKDLNENLFDSSLLNISMNWL